MDISSLNLNNATNNKSLAQIKESHSLVNKAQDSKQLKQAAQDFEAVFIQTSLQQMRPKESTGILNGGQAEQIFMQFFDEAIAKEIAKSPNNFGIADSIVNELGNSSPEI